MSLPGSVPAYGATFNAIAATDNHALASLWATVAVALPIVLGALLAASVFALASLRARGPFPLSAVAESWRPRAARAWRPLFFAHALLGQGLLAGLAAPLAPWGAGWVLAPSAAGADGGAYARGHYLILTGLWGTWRSCVADLAFMGPVCTEGAAAAPRLLLAGSLALQGGLLLLGAPAVALSALATLRVASVAGGAAPLGGRAAACCGCCSPGAPSVAGVAWAAAGAAWAASGAAWAGRRALGGLLAADARTAASALGRDAGGGGVGAGGALAAVACVLLTAGAALATWAVFTRVGHMPGLGASRAGPCSVEDDELLHETEAAARAGGKARGGAADRSAFTVRVEGVQDTSMYEMY